MRIDAAAAEPDRSPRRLLDLLRDMDMVVDRRRTDDPEPADITRAPGPPAGAPLGPPGADGPGRDRGAGQPLVPQHPRPRRLPPRDHARRRAPRLPPGAGRPTRTPATPVTIGEVRVTEVEAIEDLDGADEDRTRFDVGYGAVPRPQRAQGDRDGQPRHRVPSATQGRTQLEQSILLTTDGLDSSAASSSTSSCRTTSRSAR